MRIAQLWVRRPGDIAVPVANTFRQDPEVVAVEVHGMYTVEIISHNSPNRCALPRVEDIPFCGI